MDNDQDTDKQPKDEQASVKSRRDFLKNSKYAVYATPLVTSLIISSKAAHASSCTRPDCGLTAEPTRQGFTK